MASAAPGYLPIYLTSFIGRDAELAAVRDLLSVERLVTLTGPGGSGKTRLAAHAAAEQSGHWPDGVWWVELGTATDPALVAELVAAATGVLVEPVQGPLRSLTLQLRDRRLLVCLDNCEHLLDGAAEVADVLLRACPGVSVLTTSREPLGLPGETLLRVPALSEDEAVSLVVERGSRVRRQFALDPSNEAAVGRMCARLDGMPLALELAAAWLRTLSPQQIEAALDDRFALLVRAPRGVVARQQTLAASIAWSHDLLDEPDRIAFRRLAVFSGDFGLDAARSVCADGSAGDVLDTLGRLVDKSLVLADERDGELRYRMLETIREYGQARLDDAGEAAATRDRHLDHYLALVERAEPELDRDKDSWRMKLDHEYDNLREALEWGLSLDDPQRGRALAAGLPWLWHLHGYGHEGIEFLERAIRGAPDERSALQARLLAGVALVADTADPLDLEFDVAQRAMEMAGAHGDERTRCLCVLLSAVGQFYTDFNEARDLSVEAERTAGADGFVRDGARSLQGIVLHLRDRHDAAGPLFDAAIAGLVGRGDRGVAATVLGFHASGAAYGGDLGLARRLAEQAVEMAEPLGDYHRVGTSRCVLALVHGFAGEVAAGLQVMEPVLRLVEEAGTEVFVPGMGRVMGTLHLWSGDPAEAVRWLEPESHSTDRGAETYIAAQALPQLGAALRQLGARDEVRGVLDSGVRVARALGMPRALADAIEQQAHLAAAGDDPQRATDLHHEALSVRAQHGLRTSYLDSLDALAALAARSGRPEPAVRIVGASDAAREAIGYPRRALDGLAHETVVTELRAALGDASFAELHAEGSRLSLDDAVAYVRRARGRRRRPASGWASLTPTELHVVRLAVEGHNNPEIGARLFMSRGTVKTHLSHVYAKLGVANRTELAKLATRRALASGPPREPPAGRSGSGGTRSPGRSGP